MFGSNTLEIVIGLIVIFILISTICSAIREGIESILKTRAAYLEQGIRQLLNDKTGTRLAKDFFNHPLISGLFNGSYTPGSGWDKANVLANGKSLPSYIPSKNFARALMDIAAKGADMDVNNGSTSPIVSLASIRENISKIENPDVQRVILNAIDIAQGDLNKAQQALESWFNSAMDRVSGWYKRSTQWIILVITLFVAVGLNVNSIAIINYLNKNDTARKVLLEKAEQLNTANMAANGAPLDYEKAQEYLDEMKLPIGWDIYGKKGDTGGKKFTLTFTVILGWLITALAATLGTPYWFDLLNKVMVIRSTVKPHEKSLEEASQDAQPPAPKKVYVTPQEYENPPSGGGGSGISNAVTAQAQSHDDIDGCGVAFNDITPDEDLPEAKGGVA
ncbi:hypothetical protein [Flavobacterium rhizosphaerae]|uniref:Uncharacterized protein n=1 Tax=Flavobacterium rhizosphaerae TaxID=3163298 RepID=A0ABW8YS92_9FLAO